MTVKTVKAKRSPTRATAPRKAATSKNVGDGKQTAGPTRAPKTASVADAPETVNLPAELDLRAANGLKVLLSQGLASSGDLMLDASEVACLSTPCVQLLLAASRAAEKEGHLMKVVNPSDEFSNFVNDLGFVDAHQEWSASE